MSRMMHDVMRIQQVVTVTLGDLLRETITVVGLAAWLCFLDARLALVAISCAPLVVYPLVRLGQRVRRNTYRGQEELGRLSHVTAEAFTGHRIVKAFAAEDFEGRRFAGTSDEVYRIAMKVTSTLSVLPPLMEWLGAFAVVGVLWYGSTRIAGGEMTAGEFTAFVAALLVMYGPVKKLSRVNANIQQARAAAERVFEMFDTRSEVAESPSDVRSRRSDRRSASGTSASPTATRPASGCCAAYRSTSRPARSSPSSASAERARRPS